MQLYDFKARDKQGKMVTGQIEARDEAHAADLLMKQSCMPIEIEVHEDTFADIDWWLWLEGDLSLDELVVLTRQLYSLTRAGIPVMRAINGIKEHVHHKHLKNALENMITDLGNGRPISQSMQNHPRVFPPLFIAIVQVGENTGKLEEAFLQLASYYEQELETSKRIKTAMRYPVFVLIAITAAMIILNVFVVPKFTDMFASFGVELPLATRILIASSNFFVHYWPIPIAMVVGTYLAYKSWIKTEAGLQQRDHLKMRIPIVGDIVERSLLSRFCRSFATMLKAGVALNQALTLVSEAVDNSYVALKVRDMRTGIERGESMLRVARQTELFTPLVIQMISVGEQSGQIDSLLLEAADYYDREVDYDLKSLTARIEPILVGIVAVMVMILALGIFTPMWDMMNVFKGGG